MAPTTMGRAATARMLATASLALTATTATAQTPEFPSAEHDYRLVTIAEGFVHPWAIAFLPGGDMLVTERPGRLRVVRDGRLLPEPVAGLPEIRAAGQGGLLDVVPHPDFATNRLLYLSYSKPSDDGERGTTAVIRGRFEDDRLTAIEEVFEGELWSEGRGHYGSRLAFDHDGYLFITLGDRQAPARDDLEAHPAQDLTNHFGATIRLHDDGRVPADNSFVGGMSGQQLARLTLDGRRVVTEETLVPGQGRIRDVRQGPDGYIYLALDDRGGEPTAIVRLEPIDRRR